MKQLTEVVFILDRSGSMNGLEKDTIGGFNSVLVAGIGMDYIPLCSFCHGLPS